MEKRPSDETLAAAVGMAGKKISQLGGGPYLFHFVVENQGYQVIAFDDKVWWKSLAALGRYLKTVALLEHRQMKSEELVALVVTYGELPAGFGWMLSLQRICPYGPPPGLTYGSDGAALVVYDFEAQQQQTSPPGGPRPPMPIGLSPQIWLRATMSIGRDYKPQWNVERYNLSANRWEPR